MEMEDEKVHIYSGEHNAYWRPDACGYTYSMAEAGLWPREEAESRIKSGGPEKKLKIVESGVPVGFRRVEAYESETEFIICGEPEEEPDGLTKEEYSRWYETAHNCDVMGCGFSHVLFRFAKTPGSDTPT